MDRWEVNYKDGNGWQGTDEETVQMEIADLISDTSRAMHYRYDEAGDIHHIETGYAKYRRVTVKDLPLEQPQRYQVEEDGNVLWAI